jgi:hypothetical protein
MPLLWVVSGIDDIIVNSVALGFLLTLDEIITDAMLSAEARLGLRRIVQRDFRE